MASFVWPEKYRPDSISGMILPASIKGYFTRKIKENNIPNIIIYSHQPGSGKTSVTKAFSRELKAETEYINISMDSGIDTLRSRIDKFATTMSVTNEDGMKIVIMDEFDGASPALQKAMRAAIEEYTEFCRFFFTCNNISQVIEPIQSRCEKFHFSWTDAKSKAEMKPKILKRLTGILGKESIQYDLTVVEKIVEVHYPDIRSMIVLLEQYSSINNNIINSDIFAFKAIDGELYKLIYEKHISAARKFCIEHEYDYGDLFRALFDNYVPMLDNPNKKGQAYILIAKYMQSHAFAIDKEINFTSLLVELSDIK
jgi:DNA polymerase III delta prime subunit